MHQCQFLEEFRRTCSKDNDAEWQTNHPPSWLSNRIPSVKLVLAFNDLAGLRDRQRG